MDIKNQYLARVKRVGVVLGAWGAAASLSVASMFAMASPNEPGSAALTASTSAAASPHSAAASPRAALHLDRSGSKQVGKASFYASRYAGRTMSNGKPMKLYSSNAASLTLPLGTTAKVTNVQTGKSAVVTIQDRGPYVNGRIIDLSPATAHLIGLTTKQGVVTVVVQPVTIPLLDGSVKVIAQAMDVRHSRMMASNSR